MPVLFFSIVSSLYFSLVFVESCCYVCIVFSCFIRWGDKRPLPQMKQKWKAGRGLKRSVLFIREVYSAYVDFIVESLECWFEGDQCERHKVAINLLVLQDLGSWLPRGTGGKICSILFLRVWNLYLIANLKFNYLLSQVLYMVVEVSGITQVFRKFLRKRNWLNVYA